VAADAERAEAKTSAVKRRKTEMRITNSI